MPSIFKYTISACLFFFAAISHGQEKKPSSLKKDAAPAKEEEKAPKPKKDFRPSGFRLGTDLIDIGKTLSSTTFTGWEVNGDVDFANYYLALDVGSWGKDITIKNGDYTNSGNYYRLGIDVNFLGSDPDKNMFFLGFRVGHSNFSESVSYLTSPPHLFSPLDTTYTNPNATGQWAELTTGLRVKMWKGLWLGYTARMKFAPSVHGSPNFATYDMPGYGVIQNKIWWGFNYQVFWRFAWRKDKVIPLPK